MLEKYCPPQGPGQPFSCEPKLGVGVLVVADGDPQMLAARSTLESFFAARGVRLLSAEESSSQKQLEEQPEGKQPTIGRSSIDALVTAMTENFLLSTCKELLPDPRTTEVHSTFTFLAAARAAVQQSWDASRIASYREGVMARFCCLFDLHKLSGFIISTHLLSSHQIMSVPSYNNNYEQPASS